MKDDKELKIRTYKNIDGVWHKLDVDGLTWLDTKMTTTKVRELESEGRAVVEG